mmetsp:Transcript_87995/g.188786  ORF Transcript_87995/g.188786 Transcript_87995/m.188786 type:complete len:440 (-) Transcript_87995:1764-3083(-)
MLRSLDLRRSVLVADVRVEQPAQVQVCQHRSTLVGEDAIHHVLEVALRLALEELHDAQEGRELDLGGLFTENPEDLRHLHLRDELQDAPRQLLVERVSLHCAVARGGAFWFQRLEATEELVGAVPAEAYLSTLLSQSLTLVQHLEHAQEREEVHLDILVRIDTQSHKHEIDVLVGLPIVALQKLHGLHQLISLKNFAHVLVKDLEGPAELGEVLLRPARRKHILPFALVLHQAHPGGDALAEDYHLFTCQKTRARVRTVLHEGVHDGPLVRGLRRHTAVRQEARQIRPRDDAAAVREIGVDGLAQALSVPLPQRMHDIEEALESHGSISTQARAYHAARSGLPRSCLRHVAALAQHRDDLLLVQAAAPGTIFATARVVLVEHLIELHEVIVPMLLILVAKAILLYDELELGNVLAVSVFLEDADEGHKLVRIQSGSLRP